MLGAIRCPLSLGIGQRLGAVLTVDNALARLTPSGSFDIMLSKSHAVGFEVCGCAGVLGIQRVKIILRAGTDTKPADVGKATLKLATPFINIVLRSLYLGKPGDCGDLRLALCFSATLGLKLGSEVRRALRKRSKKARGAAFPLRVRRGARRELLTRYQRRRGARPSDRRARKSPHQG